MTEIPIRCEWVSPWASADSPGCTDPAAVTVQIGQAGRYNNPENPPYRPDGHVYELNVCPAHALLLVTESLVGNPDPDHADLLVVAPLGGPKLLRTQPWMGGDRR